MGGNLWQWCKTVVGAAVVYATLPLLALVWPAARLVRIFRSGWLYLALLVPVLAVAYPAWWLFGVSASGDERVQIQVRPGTPFGALADSLSRRGIIRHPILFRAAARLGGLDRSLHVGLYAFSPADSPYRILRQLARHEQIYLQFTVVEGAVLREVLPQIAARLEIPLDSLKGAVRSPERRSALGLTQPDLEGYLFPETYTVPLGASAATAVNTMVAQFLQVWQKVSAGYEGDLSRHEAVTLASMIEAEAREGAERRLISSVFHNRLQLNMRMQCDPTVIYAMGGLDRPLLRKDWLFESPYNTYVVSGLPPGPICSPGEASLRAALYPESSAYLYFVARGDGTHVFSATLAEHEQAAAQIKRRQRLNP